MNRMASTFGLFLALAGPPFVASTSLRLWGDRPSVTENLAGNAALWGLACALLAVVHFWERNPLSSIGLRSFNLRSLVLGVALAAVLLYVATPVGVWLVHILGLPGFESGLARLRSLPAFVLVGAAFTAGVVEELLYRGYAIERLTQLSGSVVVGALLSLVAFSLAHLPFWGITSGLFTLVAGAVLTVSYVWKHDLAANMIGHTITALVQLAALAETKIA